ncbi:uncharacterized protein YqcC (DUF446 family) [Nicoletella semolina]|uniref:Uncharacterized protein YqcC (DUF446 family) n=1 Tax=Nicoletella semolina TaxID=271160 RepID=A0A4R2N9D5_9PAST|nr:YqcC family protein [Nicoletella semolina]MDH2925484.1 anhydro-N-acetylmuramic acid kinase [Nicoletella semolina]TCP17558.1 uncharacterized protein YqcC (DUF446 family) [Nicoletella semolina]
MRISNTEIVEVQLRHRLNDLQIVLRLHHHWEQVPPSAQAMASTQPFCIDTLSATQWLQWIFIPRFLALLDAKGKLPSSLSISPYLEEALKNTPSQNAILEAMKNIERLFVK